MAFKKLLEELDIMAKSQPAAGDDDEIIQSAANSGGDSNNGQDAATSAADSAAAAAAAAGADGAAGAGDGAAGAEGADGGAADGAEQPMAKSFEVKLDSGETAQVIDAEELVKSLVDRIDAAESETGEVLGACVALIKSQGAQIEKLTASIAKLAGSGTGRKAVLSVAARADATLRKSETGADKVGLKPAEFLAKAETAFNGKAISGNDLSLAEACINRGEKVPAHIIQRVMGFGAAA